MASGFGSRWKGKLEIDRNCFWIAGTQYHGSGADLDVNTGWGTASTYSSTQTLPNGGIDIILSTALAVYSLAAPVKGRSVLLVISTSSTGWMVKVSTDSSVTIQGAIATLGGSTLTNTIKSTATLVATTVELVGLSTIAYQFMGVVPSTTSHLLFSTTT